MRRLGCLLAFCGIAIAADRNTILMVPALARAFKDRYTALTDSWVRGIEYDYRLDLVQTVSRNFPLGDFGAAHSPVRSALRAGRLPRLAPAEARFSRARTKTARST